MAITKVIASGVGVVLQRGVALLLAPILEGRSAGCGTHGCKCCRSMSHKNRIFSSTNHRGFYWLSSLSTSFNYTTGDNKINRSRVHG